MTIYFLDSRAVVKRYAVETGTTWVSQLCDPANRHTLLIASVTLVEVAAAFAAKWRSQDMTPEAYSRGMQDFIRDAAVQYRVLGVDQQVIALGVTLTSRQKLRGYDAVQLAVASTVNAALVGQQITLLTFVCADRDLHTAASNEGLPTVNPNSYP